MARIAAQFDEWAWDLTSAQHQKHLETLELRKDGTQMRQAVRLSIWLQGNYTATDFEEATMDKGVARRRRRTRQNWLDTLGHDLEQTGANDLHSHLLRLVGDDDAAWTNLSRTFAELEEYPGSPVAEREASGDVSTDPAQASTGAVSRPRAETKQLPHETQDQERDRLIQMAEMVRQEITRFHVATYQNRDLSNYNLETLETLQRLQEATATNTADALKRIEDLEAMVEGLNNSIRPNQQHFI